MRFDCLRKDHKFSRSERADRLANARAKHGFASDVSRQFGYAVALHGTGVRDIDLVAVPWTDDAISPDALALRLAGQMQLVVVGLPTQKPHGRIAVSMFDPDRPTQQIDLSIMPPWRNLKQVLSK